MTEAELLELLADHGALLQGHFLLSSGKHSDTYVEKARLFERPEVVDRLAEAITAWYERIEAVVSPAVGAIPLGFTVARTASARFLYAEREGGRLVFRRGFRLLPGERTLVVEDVVTTGGSAGELYELVQGAGAEALGVAAVVNRSDGPIPFPFRALARVALSAFDPETCPLCADGLEVRAPGSRHVASNEV
jgi:orotate phosphoribosyltransferase